MSKQEIVILADPLINDYGPSRPAVLLAREFLKAHNVTVVSTHISNDIESRLSSSGVESISLGHNAYFHDSSLAYFSYWFQELVFNKHSRSLKLPEDSAILNLSNTITSKCSAWYGQGPVSTVLRNIRGGLSWQYSLPLYILDLPFTLLDRKVILRMRRSCDVLVANSLYCKECYEKPGVKVDGVIYEPLDCDLFRPSSPNPSRDFVLTYFGKETRYDLVLQLANAGAKIVAFGGKLSSVPTCLTRHSNIECLGRVEERTLIDLYSNALITFFPFTDEEFGYVPAESIACDTPVVTYNKQGPAEVIEDHVNGFLAESDSKLLKIAEQIWLSKDTHILSKACRERALKFNSPAIAKEFERILKLNSPIEFEEHRIT